MRRCITSFIKENIPEENSGKNNSPDVNIQVPGEFLELSKDENTLAILPVMNSTMAFLFMKQQGVTDRQNTIRVRFVIKGFCPEEEFNRRIRNLFCNHPALRSSFARAGNGRYWQIFYKRKTPTVYYRDLRGLSDAASGRIFSGFWQVMAESGNTFEAGCFPLLNGNTTLLIQAEHTIIDGLSLQIIQNELLSSGTGNIHEDALLRYRQRQILAAKSFPEDFFGIYEGIVSEDFGTADPQILESEILGGDNLRGNRMSVKDGCLNIAFYHEDNSEQNAFYRNVKALMLQDLTLPPAP